MTTLFRRLAAPAAGLLLFVAVGTAAMVLRAQDVDMDIESDGNAPVAKNLDEAAIQIQRLRHQMRRLERQIGRLEQNLLGAMGMMSQVPMMGEGMMPGMGQGMMGMPGQRPMMGQMPMMGMQGQMPMQCMGMMGQMPMMDQGMMGQGMMGHMRMMGQGMGKWSDPVTRAFQEAGYRMHHGMKDALTGAIDRDFVASMIPHHQGAVDMAEIVLKNGTDPEVKKLAEAIIATQKAEIAELEEWLKKHPQ